MFKWGDNTSTGLSVLTAHTANVTQWYMQNSLQLNPDKSEALIIGTAHHLRAATSTVELCRLSLSPMSICRYLTK